MGRTMAVIFSIGCQIQ